MDYLYILDTTERQQEKRNRTTDIERMHITMERYILDNLFSSLMSYLTTTNAGVAYQQGICGRDR